MLWDLFLDAVLPRVCLVCDRRFDGPGTVLCGPCEESIGWIAGPSCLGCGAPVLVERPRPRRCPRCRGSSWSIPRAVCAARYAGAAETLIRRLKYDGQPAAAGPLAARLAGRLREEGVAVDFATAVPSDRWSYVRRTYNPAEEIGALVAASLEVPFDDHALAKSRRTPPQADLPRARRLRNPAGAYRASAVRVHGRRVLLVDDVLTTGATAGECAKALWRAGASDVVVACAARTL